MRVLIVLSITLLLVGQVRAATIELYNPTYPTPWCLPIVADEPISFTIVLHPEGATDIIGAKLCILGLPSGCSATATPSAAAVSAVGDLFSNSGAEILFVSPQTNEDVALYEVRMSCPMSSLGNIVTLRPAAPLLASTFARCPFVVIVGMPEPTYSCAAYNALSNNPLWCEIGVEAGV